MSHTETTIAVNPSRLVRHTVEPHVQSETMSLANESHHDYRPAVAALLLGVRYRGYLVPSEQQLLDDLAGEQGISFLLRGQTYLHPAKVELFPPQEISTVMCAGSGSVFSQTWRSTSNGRQTYALMTVALGPAGADRLIFGTLIPLGLRKDQSAVSRFHETARIFEKARREIDHLAIQIDKQLQPHTTWLLVNRASGRTIAVSASASQILKRNCHELVDVEFGRVKEALTPVISHTSLSLTTLSSDLLPICVVRLEPRLSHSDHGDLAAFLVHKMRNKISAIYTASTYLQSTTCWKCESDEADLARMIETEVSELDQHLHRFYLLLDYDQMPKTSVNIAEAFGTRASAIRGARPGIQELKVVNDGGRAVVAAPTGAIENLLESIIQAHTYDYVSPATVEVAIRTESQAALITIRTTLQAGHTHLAPAVGWSSIAERLTSLLDGTISQHTDKDNGIFSTELCIPLTQEPQNWNQPHVQSDEHSYC